MVRIQYVYEREYGPTRHGRLDYPNVDGLEGRAAQAQLRIFVNEYFGRIRRRAEVEPEG